MLVYLLIYKLKKYNKNRYINKLPRKDIPKYALISIGMGGLSALWLIFADKILSSITLVKNSLQNFSQISESLNNEAYIFIFLSVILFGPVVEELLFRGLIFNEIDKIKGGATPIILSGLLFGLFHREPVQVVYSSILGIILGFVYSKTRSLPLVIFMHMLNNLVATLPPPLAKHEILQFVNGFQIISVIPMVYLLYKLYKKGSLTS
ncbi:CPBP family intramembrane glutamic endopeptidase [Clostridium perfringens]|uniref:CPBP family intramembrane glutamic endopeptidase n=1 Tax=Clostridium perfringens TaxID=1502 RepID=UPI0013E3C9DA|nr:CPBP family intramembrane glutamic endopeptidase [Clostridium perfringens]EJT5939189.1 CPBP family intramembrane metalloprotease [Clostridium perfringens]EJT6471128.1 CPBP family intramembrane metalloprotease [Clostridium perfringens]MDK0721052.1 CPBP family intramembrane metalloprotease [Clostridium perfringens]MDK0768149.1 CPBP family intramembrane metalloprotease [Clostridium perfringens]MDK0770795.1 CPBP family intramembrane metalloprotease [Clostridium perfringens]